MGDVANKVNYFFPHMMAMLIILVLWKEKKQGLFSQTIELIELALYSYSLHFKVQEFAFTFCLAADKDSYKITDW